MALRCFFRLGKKLSGANIIDRPVPSMYTAFDNTQLIFKNHKHMKWYDNSCLNQAYPFQDKGQNEGGNENFQFGLMFIPVTLKTLLGLSEDKEETPEQMLIRHIQKSVLLIRNGEPLKAERLLHVALKMAQEQQNQDGITYIYDVLANLAFDNEEYKKAEKLFINVLQRLLASGLPQDDIKIVHISLKLAKTYEVLSDFQKCEEGFIFCIKTLQKLISAGAKDDDTLLLRSMTLDWYARYLLLTDRAEEAVKHLKSALTVAVEVSGIHHEQSVVLLNDLGTASSIAGDQESAAEYFERALNIAKSLEDSPEMASIMVNLGVVHLKNAAYANAKHWCTLGLNQAKQEKSRDSHKEAEECLEEIQKALNSASIQ